MESVVGGNSGSEGVGAYIDRQQTEGDGRGVRG